MTGETLESRVETLELQVLALRRRVRALSRVVVIMSGRDRVSDGVTLDQKAQEIEDAIGRDL